MFPRTVVRTLVYRMLVGGGECCPGQVKTRKPFSLNRSTRKSGSRYISHLCAREQQLHDKEHKISG